MSRANINAVETSGASHVAAKQDRLGYSGVRASHEMAETDAGRVEWYRSHINRAAEEHGVDPAVVAGIMSRESRAGNALRDGCGDGGRAFGLMQIDVIPTGGNHTPRGAWDSYEHINQATGILVGFINKVAKKVPDWSEEQKLKGGIAAYNAGDGRVSSYGDVDSRTTGRDYSNDVIARAQWYKNNKGY